MNAEMNAIKLVGRKVTVEQRDWAVKALSGALKLNREIMSYNLEQVADMLVVEAATWSRLAVLGRLQARASALLAEGVSEEIRELMRVTIPATKAAPAVKVNGTAVAPKAASATAPKATGANPNALFKKGDKVSLKIGRGSATGKVVGVEDGCAFIDYLSPTTGEAMSTSRKFEALELAGDEVDIG